MMTYISEVVAPPWAKINYIVHICVDSMEPIALKA